MPRMRQPPFLPSLCVPMHGECWRIPLLGWGRSAQQHGQRIDKRATNLSVLAAMVKA